MNMNMKILKFNQYLPYATHYVFNLYWPAPEINGVGELNT